mgnify:CR=1 FL=1
MPDITVDNEVITFVEKHDTMKKQYVRKYLAVFGTVVIIGIIMMFVLDDNEKTFLEGDYVSLVGFILAVGGFITGLICAIAPSRFGIGNVTYEKWVVIGKEEFDKLAKLGKWE